MAGRRRGRSGCRLGRIGRRRGPGGRGSASVGVEVGYVGSGVSAGVGRVSRRFRRPSVAVEAVPGVGRARRVGVEVAVGAGSASVGVDVARLLVQACRSASTLRSQSALRVGRR